MIQRIQSIWLLLAALTIFILLAVPVLGIQNNGTEFSFSATGLFQENKGIAKKIDSFIPLTIAVVAVGLICFGSIFGFRNRMLQKRIILLAILLIILLSILIFSYAQQIPGGIANAHYGVGTFLPPLALIFCLLALRGIRKDEQLLRSADRLR